MQLKHKIKIGFFLALVWGASCKKLVNVPPPTSQLVTTSVFNNDYAAIAAQLAVYAEMQNQPWTFDLCFALSADEMTNYSSSSLTVDLYKNKLSATVDGNNLPWAVLYKYIYQENAIIENVKASTDITTNTVHLLVGEAQFVRAYLYFYLVNMYGDVPLVISTDYKSNTALGRTHATQVYQQMIQDLKSAQNLLSSTYLDATDTVVVSDRVRPTTWAASALLARVYLYTQKYDSAEAQATNILNNTNLFSLPSLDLAFSSSSTEAIWQIAPPSSMATYTYDGLYFILTKAAGGSSTGGCCTISTQMISAFESGDNRRIHWVDSIKSNGTTWYFPYKYKSTSTSKPVVEYTMVLRLAEQYLIRAEARAQQNNLSGAVSDINVVRARAGLPGLSTGLSQSQLLSAIAHERQVELFTESHRWMDLKRTGAADVVMNGVTPQKGGGNWDPNQELYPILVTDIQNGINISQNPGY